MPKENKQRKRQWNQETILENSKDSIISKWRKFGKMCNGHNITFACLYTYEVEHIFNKKHYPLPTTYSEVQLIISIHINICAATWRCRVLCKSISYCVININTKNTPIDRKIGPFIHRSYFSKWSFKKTKFRHMQKKQDITVHRHGLYGCPIFAPLHQAVNTSPALILGCFCYLTVVAQWQCHKEICSSSTNVFF